MSVACGLREWGSDSINKHARLCLNPSLQTGKASLYMAYLSAVELQWYYRPRLVQPSVSVKKYISSLLLHAPVFVRLPPKREDLEKKQEAETLMGSEFFLGAGGLKFRV